MCGIVGYVGSRSSTDVLIKGLKRLEYRGYDSTGVSGFFSGQIEITKSEGKLKKVEDLLTSEERRHWKESLCGIGHTRWATHGKPTTQNAHPHRVGSVVLVHNGIIENYLEIKEKVLEKGLKPESDTDSELFGFLVQDELDQGDDLAGAVQKSFSKIKGNCSVVVMSESEPDTIVAGRQGAPLVAGIDPDGGALVASDPQPILEYTKDIYFLEDGDLIKLQKKNQKTSLQFFDLSSGKEIKRDTQKLDWSADQLDKLGYPHYMLKEIYEQPTAVVNTINGVIDRGMEEPFYLADSKVVEILEKAKRITMIACGTSFHAALLGKYWLEKWANMPVKVEYASEFRYSSPMVEPDTVLLGVSQSGETADTLAVMKEFKKRGVPTMVITNVRGSSLSRECDASIFTLAGPEIGVAATKTFTTQLTVLMMLAGFFAKRNKTGSFEKLEHWYQEMIRVPQLLSSLVTPGDLHPSNSFTKKIKSVSQELQNLKGFFFIGRGYSYPLALEAALKLKEIAYVHAEGYAAGELKHGPIAMIEEGMGVVVFAPKDRWREKTISNLEEVRARGATILGIGSEKDSDLKTLSHAWIEIPELEETLDSEVSEMLQSFLMIPALQLLSYELACLKDTDVDQPRNLAKSVTVE